MGLTLRYTSSIVLSHHHIDENWQAILRHAQVGAHASHRFSFSNLRTCLYSRVPKKTPPAMKLKITKKHAHSHQDVNRVCFQSLLRPQAGSTEKPAKSNTYKVKVLHTVMRMTQLQNQRPNLAAISARGGSRRQQQLRRRFSPFWWNDVTIASLSATMAF